MFPLVRLRHASVAATCVCLAYLASCSGGGAGNGGTAGGTSWTYDTAWVNAANVWSATVTTVCENEPAEACGAEGRALAEAAGASVWSWSFLPWHARWPAVAGDMVELAHARGRRFVGTLSNLWFWHRAAPRPAVYDAARRMDPFANPVIDDAGWFLGDATNFSGLHSLWEGLLVEQLTDYVEQGVDAVLIDEGAYIGEPMDFNPDVVAGFKTYLQATLSSQALLDVVTQLGLASFDDFDYARVWREHLPTGTTGIDDATYANASQLGIPLWEEYGRYMRERAVQVMTRVITTVRQRAAQLGRELPVGFNVNTAPMHGLPSLHLLDYVDLEFFYSVPGSAHPQYDYFPEARGGPTIALMAALGLRGNLLPSVPTSTDLRARGSGNVENAIKVMIADGFASGGRFHVDEPSGGLGADFDALLPYYQFVNRRPDLFGGFAARTPNVGLVQLWEQYEFDPRRGLDGASQILADGGYRFDVLFGAEDVSRTHPAPRFSLDAGRLAAHEALIVPRLAMCWQCGAAGTGLMLTENHADRLLDHVANGGLLVVLADPAEVAAGLVAATGPRADTLLGYLDGGESALGAGTLVHIAQVLGPAYQASVDAPGAAAVRARLIDVLKARGIEPEVAYGVSPRAVSAFLYRAPDRSVLHLVNFDHAIDTDTLTPVNDLEVGIALSVLPPAASYRVTWQRPEAPDGSVVPGAIANGRLAVTVPVIEPWSVLRIEPEN